MKSTIAALLLCFALTACQTFQKVETYASNVGAALTGHNATITVEVIGSSVDSIMQGAAKARHDGDLTAAQWDKIAALHDRYQPIYNAEVAAIVKANGTAAGAPPSPTLASLYAEFSSLVASFKTPAK